MEWQAQWIWSADSERRPLNAMIIARTNVELPAITGATLAITADSQYRLYINGHWVEDGPCRSWPRHYQYDVVDVTTLLRPGRNTIAIVARHFGISTFHQVPQEAGVLAQLTATTADGRRIVVGTDESWKVIAHPCHVPDTARISIQMEQVEWYDATRAIPGMLYTDFDDSNWPHAAAYHPAEGGPWQDLHPRDVPFLTREPIFPQRLVESHVVNNVARTVSFDLKRLAYPHDLTANIVPIAGALATVLVSEYDQKLPIMVHGWGVTLSLNGQPVQENLLHLHVGENLLVIGCCQRGHLYDYSLGFRTWDGITQRNPCAAADLNPWAWIGPFDTVDNTSNLQDNSQYTVDPQTAAKIVAYNTALDAASFASLAGADYHPTPTGVMLVQDSYLAFRSRELVRSADTLLTARTAMLSDNAEWTTIQPATDGDIELCFDLGRETVGWVEFELVAPAGTIVDAHLIEYRNGDNLQYTDGNRNGFRYIAREGLNRFVSMKRRAGRYLYLTLRAMSAPVRLRTVRMLQATYPVEYRGAFRCSDAALNRIWDISTYTLRLCMEDTFTDCPLYEQTMWVGDARNESLYNAITFGADDITLRCLRLTAQSLDTMPMVGCQVPSGWDIILTAWSMLWVINVWEYYFTSGDRAGLVELYPAVMTTLRYADTQCTDHGLLSLQAWNMFDWAGVDQHQRTVMHNSLFLVGAIDAARQCAQTLGTEDEAWLSAFRIRLVSAITALWDTEKGSYPDAIRDDGTISPSTCQHTSALALLYEALPAGTAVTALQNILTPPEGMVRVGSPFALQYFLEALEHVGDAAHAVDLIRTYWQEMLDRGATTCWETFSGYEAVYPTRSHCHAWSSAPIYVFNRLLLGIVPTDVAAREVVVSPHPLGLTWAEGASASAKGDLKVAWRVQDGTINLRIDMPKGVAWRVEPNADWQGIERVLVNGVEQADITVRV